MTNPSAANASASSELLAIFKRTSVSSGSGLLTITSFNRGANDGTAATASAINVFTSSIGSGLLTMAACIATAEKYGASLISSIGSGPRFGAGTGLGISLTAHDIF